MSVPPSAAMMEAPPDKRNESPDSEAAFSDIVGIRWDSDAHAGTILV